MRLLCAVLMLITLNGCSTTVASAGSFSSSDLSGCYVKAGSEDAGRVLLTIHPDGNYTAFVIAGLGVWGKATGKWFMDSEGLYFGPSNETKNWHHYMHAIKVDRSGNSIVLVDDPVRFTKSHSSECGL